MHLVIGSTSCFGRAVVAALSEAGEEVRTLDTGWMDLQTVVDAARDCVSITAAAELPMHRWDPELTRLAENICAAAEASGATILLPSSLYGFKVVYDVPLPADPPLADINDAPCEPGRVRDAIEATYAQLAELHGHRVIVVRTGDAFGPGSIEWPAAGMVAAARAGQPVPWPGPSEVGHSFTYLPDLARLGVRALLGPPLPKPLRTAEELADPDLPPASPLEVYALHGHFVANAATWARALGARGARRTPKAWVHAQALWSPEHKHIREVLYTWSGGIFLDERASRAWVPGWSETPLDVAITETLRHA